MSKAIAHTTCSTVRNKDTNPYMAIRRYFVRITVGSVLSMLLALYALVLFGPHVPAVLSYFDYHGQAKCHAPNSGLKERCKVLSKLTRDQPVQAYYFVSKEPDGVVQMVFRQLHSAPRPDGVYNTLTGAITIYNADQYSLHHLTNVVLHEQKHAWQLTQNPELYLLGVAETVLPYEERVLEQDARRYADRNQEAVFRHAVDELSRNN